MKTKFHKLLSDKCKDMGLTDKALNSLIDLGIEGLNEESSDEEIAAKVDTLVPFAKIMQSEITRKTSKQKTITSKPSKEEDDDEGYTKKSDDIPDWFKPFQEKVSALESENAQLKETARKATRQNDIARLAKKFDIPDYLLKRVSFNDEADIEKEMADFKQDLVNNNLVPKEQAQVLGSTEEAMKAEAKSWAAGLADK